MRKATAIFLALGWGWLTMSAGAAESPIETVPLAAIGDDNAPAPAQTPEAKFETFEDGEPRITLIPRDGDDNCRAEGSVKLGQDLRSVIFLDPAAAQDCFGPGKRRIETYAGFDGDNDRDTLEQCLAPQAVCATLADSLRLSKQRHRTVLRSDGWIDVIVVTKGDAALAATPLRYTIVLHTNQAHLTVDLRAFATMLSDMTAY